MKLENSRTIFLVSLRSQLLKPAQFQLQRKPFMKYQDSNAFPVEANPYPALNILVNLFDNVVSYLKKRVLETSVSEPIELRHVAYKNCWNYMQLNIKYNKTLYFSYISII